MPELVGFQTMVILDPYGITFNAVGVFGLDFQLLFKSGSSYCDYLPAMMADAVFTWMTTFSPALKVWNILIQKAWTTVDTLLLWLWMLWTQRM